MAVIRSFADKTSANVYEGKACKKPSSDIQKKAQKVMVMIDGLHKPEDLYPFKGLALHKLSVRNRPHLWSVRVNDQWRIIFDWDESSRTADNVELCDYH